ncbi:hypothetical protein J2X92_005516 [Variovorax paradoxus]|nr:hypothetical protein [Variovorax paradoxus]
MVIWRTGMVSHCAMSSRGSMTQALTARSIYEALGAR